MPEQSGSKVGGCCVPFRGGAGSPSNNVAWAEAYLRTKWHPDSSNNLVTIDMVRKAGCCCALFCVGSWSPSNTMSPGSRSTSIPSDILICPTVWSHSQYTNVTDRQDREDNLTYNGRPKIYDNYLTLSGQQKGNHSILTVLKAQQDPQEPCE